MKYIDKKDPPETFTQWKESQLRQSQDWKTLWKRFRRNTNVKRAMYQSLLDEQGYLCCYCGRSIDIETSHIEHLKPRHKYPDLTLEYHNLLASCPGYEDEQEIDEQAIDEQEMIENENQPTPKHCGHYKDDERNSYQNEDLRISPSDIDCETYFRYDENGNIFPVEEQDKQEIADVTIKKLGLDSPQLQRARKNAIDGYLGSSEKLELTPQEIDKLIEELDKRDDDGKYLEFCFAIKSILVN